MGERQTEAGVWLPATFTDNHIQAVLKYLDQGRWALSRADWRWALAFAYRPFARGATRFLHQPLPTPETQADGGGVDADSRLETD